MTEPQKVSNGDCRIAAQALIHWGTGDMAGLNEVLAPVEDDPGRATAVLLATLQAVHNLCPELREPDRVAKLRRLIATFAPDDDPDDDPKRPPRRLY